MSLENEETKRVIRKHDSILEQVNRKYGFSDLGSIPTETDKAHPGLAEAWRGYEFPNLNIIGGAATEHEPEDSEGKISRTVAAEVRNLAYRLDRSFDEAAASLEQILSDPDLPSEQRSQYEGIRDDIANCQSASARIIAAPPDQLVAHAAVAVADAAGITGSADALNTTARSSKWRFLWEQFERLLSGIPNLLWQLISRLVTVREWTIEGEINSGLFPGGKAGIKVTFG